MSVTAAGRVLLAATLVGGCARAHHAPAIAPRAAVASAVTMDQIRSGTITGVVLGSTGRAINRALVVIDRRQTSTDSLGRFRFDSVAAGSHAMRVMALGFVSLRRDVTLADDAGAALLVRLPTSPVRLTEVCLTYALPSVYVHVPSVPRAVVRVAHRDSVERFVLDSLPGVPVADDFRTVAAFFELPGRFDVTADAPGYRQWRGSVEVGRDACHVISAHVTVRLERGR